MPASNAGSGVRIRLLVSFLSQRRREASRAGGEFDLPVTRVAAAAGEFLAGALDLLDPVSFAHP